MRLRLAVVAVRGERLALTRLEVRTADVSPGAPHDEFLALGGLDGDGRIACSVAFDLDDIDAAMAELDAVHAQFESEQPKARRLDNACVHVIRRLDDALERDDWDEVEQQFATEISAEDRRKIVGFPRSILSPREWVGGVRRIRELGGWRLRREVLALRGERLALTRFVVGAADADPGAPEEELLHLFGIDSEGRIALHVAFDIDDIDAAIAELDAAHARIEEPHRRPPLENAVSRVCERHISQFAARDWAAMADTLAADVSVDDRRRVVNAGTRHGRDAEIEELRAIAAVGITKLTLVVIATRGDRLALSRARMSGRDQRPEAFHTEVLNVAEIDADGRIAAIVTFDVDDFEAAVTELDARYVAGEGAVHANTWSLIAQAFAALNRHELTDLPQTTPGYRIYDHRLQSTVEAADLTALFRAMWDLTPELLMYVEAVHRLNDHGALITQGAHGTSRDGFDAQWRMIQLLAVEGELGTHCELFDEKDVGAAIARFEQLSLPSRRLENSASRAYDRLQANFAARDWDSMAEILAEGISADDRRRVVNAGIQRGRDTAIAEMSGIAEIGVKAMTSDVIATRGERLLLSRSRSIGRNEHPHTFHVEVLDIIEIDADERIVARVVFDPDDIESAFDELDARYLAGEAAMHSETWSVVAGAVAAINRHELPELTSDWVNIDHRRAVAFAPGEMTEYVRAILDDASDLGVYIEAVHRLTNLGTVVTQASHATSHQGFDAEWRMISLSTVDGDLINRCELFDEADLDTALAKFEQLTRPVPRLENAATRVAERYRDPSQPATGMPLPRSWPTTYPVTIVAGW